MSDHLVRAISEDGLIKAMAISCRDMVERARGIHDTTPLASAALGRTLAAASMMGADLKGQEGSVTVRLKGDGPLGVILAVGECDGSARGYVQNPAADLPLKENGKLDVGGGVGHRGSLTVVKDLGMKEPYVGTVELLGGEIAEDIAAYVVESEQIPTACALGVLVEVDWSIRAAGGYLLQLLPGAGEETAARLEKAVLAAGPVTQLLDRGMTPQEILRLVLAEFHPRILETTPVAYRCDCSRDRVARALLSMGREELKDLASQNQDTEITCQFCDNVYHFSDKELLEMAEKGSV